MAPISSNDRQAPSIYLTTVSVPDSTIPDASLPSPRSKAFAARKLSTALPVVFNNRKPGPKYGLARSKTPSTLYSFASEKASRSRTLHHRASFYSVSSTSQDPSRDLTPTELKLSTYSKVGRCNSLTTHTATDTVICTAVTTGDVTLHLHSPRACTGRAGRRPRLAGRPAGWADRLGTLLSRYSGTDKTVAARRNVSALLDELPAIIRYNTYSTYMHARITHLLPVPGWHFHFFPRSPLAHSSNQKRSVAGVEALIGASAAAVSARGLGF